MKMKKGTRRDAIVLYSMLTNITDFVAEIAVSDNDTLQILHDMLTLPHEAHSADTRRLNRIGADLVEGLMTRRGLTCLPISRLLKVNDNVSSEEKR
jgi:hypothetical protein